MLKLRFMILMKDKSMHVSESSNRVSPINVVIKCARKFSLQQHLSAQQQLITNYHGCLCLWIKYIQYHNIDSRIDILQNVFRIRRDPFD